MAIAENVKNFITKNKILCGNGFVCSCHSGMRTVGMCSHCKSVIWYLGYRRFQNFEAKVPNFHSQGVSFKTLDLEDEDDNVYEDDDDDDEGDAH